MDTTQAAYEAFYQMPQWAQDCYDEFRECCDEEGYAYEIYQWIRETVATRDYLRVNPAGWSTAAAGLQEANQILAFLGYTGE